MMRRWGRGSSVATTLAVVTCGGAIVVACASFGVTNDPGAGPQPVSDGGADGTADGALESGAGGGQGFCAMHLGAAGCNDFDGVDVLGGWTTELTDGGALETDETLFHSAPRSLRSGIVGNTSFTPARLIRPIPPTAKRVRLSFVVRRGQGALAAKQQLSIAEVLCAGSAAGAEGVWIFLENPTFDVNAHQVTGGNDVVVPLPPLVVNDWTAIVLDAHLQGASPTVDVTVGGASATSVALSPSCLTAPSFYFTVGLSTFTSGVSGKAFFDDVLYEIDPP